MNDTPTPRTDAQGYGDGRHPYVPVEFARQLERELEQERQDRKQAEADICRALGERNDARAELAAAKEAAAAEFCRLNRDLTRQSEQAERHRVALVAERALADRLAEALNESTEGFGDRMSCEESCQCAGRRIVKVNKEALAAWKASRDPNGNQTKEQP